LWHILNKNKKKQKLREEKRNFCFFSAEKENNKTEKWGQIPEKHGFRQRERPVGELLAFRGEYK
jgi:hypothetical protein